LRSSTPPTSFLPLLPRLHDVSSRAIVFYQVLGIEFWVVVVVCDERSIGGNGG
jgi:hypothetical protein